MKKIFFLYKKIGGKDFLRQLMQLHMLLYFFLVLLTVGFDRKSLEIVRLALNNRRLQKLRKKNKSFIKCYLDNESNVSERKKSNKVWVLWLQVMESAPLVVKRCFWSLKHNLRNREIILLTEANYCDYITFPEFIQTKIDKGVISRTHLSDLLRLELLEKYGGTWIDATVYCSGSDYPDYLFDSDLFVFQCLKPGLDGECLRISSWFMSSSSNHPIISLTKALLYNYWKKHDSLIDYFLIHDFFELAIETYPNEWGKVVPFSNSLPHILLLRLFDPFDSLVWTSVTRQTCFHKLSYKFEKKMELLKDTYYERIVKNELITGT